jgi:hypothetical protein
MPAYKHSSKMAQNNYIGFFGKEGGILGELMTTLLQIITTKIVIIYYQFWRMKVNKT